MKHLAFLIISLISKELLAAACCGSSSSLPGIITADHKWQIATSMSQSKIVAKTNPEAISSFRSEGDDETAITYKITPSVLIAEQFQLSFDIPYIQKKHQIDSHLMGQSSGLGDLSGSLIYEFLPEYTYHPIKPKGFIYIKQTIASGKNFKEDPGRLPVQIQGTGQNKTSIGLVFVKIKNSMDYLFNHESGLIHSKTYDKTKYNNALTFRNMIAVGKSFSKSRFGTNIAYNYETPQVIETETRKLQSSLKQYFDIGLNYSYLLKQGRSLTIGVNDQTLLGPAKNVSLTRSVFVNFLFAKSL